MADTKKGGLGTVEAKGEPTAQSDGKWGVKDKNHRPGNPPRVHEPVLGHSYPLTHDAFTMMPAAHAVHFLGDPAFEVINEDAVKVAPIPKGKTSKGEEYRPAPGQVVAALEELTTDALLARAQLTPGGERLTKRNGREPIIKFIIDAQMAVAEGRTPGRASAPPTGDADEMDDDALAKLMDA